MMPEHELQQVREQLRQATGPARKDLEAREMQLANRVRRRAAEFQRQADELTALAGAQPKKPLFGKRKKE